MKLSVSTWNYLKSYGGSANLEAAIREIKEDGFGIELWPNWTEGTIWQGMKWEDIEQLTDGVVALSLHGGATFREKETFDSMKKEIDFAAYLNIRIVVVHAKAMGINSLNGVSQGDVRLNDASGFERMSRAVEYANKCNVTLALENGALNVLKEAVRACGTKICLDVGHANCGPEGPVDRAVSFIDEFSSDIIHSHLSDNFGYDDLHNMPGHGTVNWENFLRKTRTLDYGGQYVLELNTKDARMSAVCSREFLRNVLKVHEVLVFERLQE